MVCVFGQVRGKYQGAGQERPAAVLPVDMIQAFFRPAISKCITHVKELLQAINLSTL